MDRQNSSSKAMNAYRDRNPPSLSPKDACEPNRKSHDAFRPDLQTRNPPHEVSSRSNPNIEQFIDETILIRCRGLLAGLGNPNARLDAEDVRQEVHLKLLEGKFADLDPTKNPRGFIYQSARSLVCDQERKRRRRHVAPLDGDVRETIAEQADIDVNDNRASRLCEAIGQLAAIEREVLHYDYWEGWLHARIALRLKITKERVARIAFIARRKLRKLLGEDFLSD